MNPDELDDELRANVEAQVRERAARRERMREVRRQFDRRRQAGVAKRNAQRLARTRRADEGKETVMTVTQETGPLAAQKAAGTHFDGFVLGTDRGEQVRDLRSAVSALYDSFEDDDNATEPHDDDENAAFMFRTVTAIVAEEVHRRAYARAEEGLARMGYKPDPAWAETQCIELGCTSPAARPDAYCKPHGDAVHKHEQCPIGACTCGAGELPG